MLKPFLLAIFLIHTPKQNFPPKNLRSQITTVIFVVK